MSTHTAPTHSRTRLRRILFRLAMVLVVLAAILCICISALAAFILTTPNRVFGPETPAVVGLAYQQVRFPARGEAVEISAWFMPAATQRRAVVLVHGIGCSRTCWFSNSMAGLPLSLHQNGLAVLAIDLRGHGRSSDAHYAFGLTERRDVLGAVDWLMAQGFQPKSIGVLGLSLGAAASIGALADDPTIGALVGDCGYAEIYPLIAREWEQVSNLPYVFLPSSLFMAWLLFGYDIAAARPVEEIDEIAPRPVLIIHGMADTYVPVENARRLKAALPSAEYWEVPGAGHSSSYITAPQQYETRVNAFFERSLP